MSVETKLSVLETGISSSTLCARET